MEKEIVATRPADVAALVRGYFRARDFAVEHPDEAYPIMAARIHISPEAFRESVTTGIRLLGRDDQAAYFGPGGILERTMKRNNIALRDAGQLKGPDRATDLIAPSPPVAFARR